MNFFKNISFLNRGFTLIELLVVVAILGILSSTVLTFTMGAREAAYMSKAKQEFRSFHQSVEFYFSDYGSYPIDVGRDIPPGLESYLAPGLWPSAPWPGSVYDWENWTDAGTGEKIYQISIRFCIDIDDPDTCDFPDQDWTEDFNVRSGVFYCISGPCRSHINMPVDNPGYCVNCTEPQYPYGIY